MSVVGDLVANFSANTTGFTKPVQAMRKETASFAASMKSSIGSVMGAFAPLTAIVAPIAGAFAFKHVVDSAREAAGAAKKFQAVLDATGGAAGISTKEMQEFAGQLQKTTNFEDDATVGAAALLATFTNIRGDTFKRAIESAMDFATVTGTDLPAAISLIGKALNDPVNGMMKLRKAGIQLTDEQKKQVAAFQKTGDMAAAQGVILDAMQGRFGGAAKAMASPFTQVTNIIGDISENIGFALLPALKEVVLVVTDWAEPIQNATQAFKDFGEDVAFVVRNFTTLWQVAGINMELAIIEAIPGMEHGFEELGATIYGLWEGAKAGFGSFLRNVLGGFEEIKNVFQAVVAGVNAAWSSIASGKISDAGNAFADAFVKTLAEQKGAAPAENPFTEFTNAFKKAREDAIKGFADPGGGLSDQLKKERDKLLDSIADAEEKRKKPDRIPGKTPELPGEKHGSEKVAAEAAVFNSKEALHTIFTAMGSAGKSDAERAADAAERAADKAEEIADNTEEVASNTKVLRDVDFIAVVVT